MQRKLTLALMILFFSGLPLWAQSAPPAGELPPLLPREREIALAENAGLSSWVKEAAVYVLERGGYVKVREGTNGFSCLVRRGRPDTLEPMCLDPEGTETMLPRYLREAELRAQGKDYDAIRRKIAEGFLRGKYRAPRKPGINYMLSSENYVWIRDQVVWFPPHLMIYAPYATSQDVGADPTLMPHSPFVLFEGDPHAYFVVVVPEAMPTPPPGPQTGSH